MLNIKDIEKDIQSVFTEVGDKVSFLRFQGAETNIYNESKAKKYSKPIECIGRVKFNPTTEELSDIGRREEVNALFSFSSKELKNKKLVTDEETVLISLDDRIEFRGVKYKIVNIRPATLIGYIFHTYKFECKEIL